MAKTETECPWCQQSVTPAVNLSRSQYGEIAERKCPKCGNILATYLSEQGKMLEKVRSFQNEK